MPHLTHKPATKLTEQGFASIVIALVLIIVLALFTVGFAQLARREQKNALDKQLATQAYYAAETGLNDTAQQIPALEAQAAAGHPPNPDQCLRPPTTIGQSQNGVQYTCVLVNLTPPNIKYDNVQPETSRYIVSSATSATGGAASITVNWGSDDGNNSFPGDTNGGFLPLSEWNDSSHKYPAVLEFNLTPLNDLSRAGLADNSFTVYLYPVNHGGGSVAYTTVSQGGSNNGAIVAANCDAAANGAAYPCKATITGVTGGTGDYLFRVTDHYDPSNIIINGTDSLGKPTVFDGQVQLDATGKAHEVLKRLQVRKPLKASVDGLPADALTSQSTCKHFTTDPLATNGYTDVGLGQDSVGACNFN